MARPNWLADSTPDPGRAARSDDSRVAAVLVGPGPYFCPVSWTPVSTAMRQLHKDLAGWPDGDIEHLHRRPEWVQARALGWVMESAEGSANSS